MNKTIYIHGDIFDDTKLFLAQHKYQIVSTLSSRTKFLLLGNNSNEFNENILDEAKKNKIPVLSFNELKSTETKSLETETKTPNSKQNETNLSPWVDKYSPKNLDSIIGNRNNLEIMLSFLKQTDSNLMLISGPPGQGKTTAAKVVALSLNRNVQECNASDERNSEKLKEELTLKLYCKTSINGRSNVLIMDEIDGMDGREDRGGMKTFLELAKKTSTPIICICNDEFSNSAVKSLKNHVLLKFQIRWSIAPTHQILNRLKTIIQSENIDCLNQLRDDQLTMVIESNKHDIRHIINELQFFSNTFNVKTKMNSESTKDTVSFNYYQTVPQLFNSKTDTEYLENSFDYSQHWFQENYLNCIANPLMDIAKTADLISMADLMSAQSFTSNEFSSKSNIFSLALLEPSKIMTPHHSGIVSKMIYHNTKQNSVKQLKQKLRNYSLPFISLLYDKVVLFLQNKQTNEAVLCLDEYKLNSDDWKCIANLLIMCRNQYDELSAATKSAFTKAMNKK